MKKKTIKQQPMSESEFQKHILEAFRNDPNIKLPLYQNLWVNFGSGSLPRA